MVNRLWRAWGRGHVYDDVVDQGQVECLGSDLFIAEFFDGC